MNKTELNETLYTALKELGLSPQEISLYSISLFLGPSPIARLAQELEISRPNVYKLISGLEKRGLAQFSSKKKFSRDFVVEPPTKLLEQFRAKQGSYVEIEGKISTAMPDLLAQYRQGDRPMRVQVLEGAEQYRKAFSKIVNEAKKEILVFGSIDDFIAASGFKEYRELVNDRVKRGITLRSLFLPGPKASEILALGTKELRQTRILNGTQPFVTSFQLYANKVMIWQPKTPLVLIIEDEYVTTMLRSMFEMLWSQTGDAIEKTQAEIAN